MTRCSLEDIPTSVYRIQLSEKFPLKSAIALIPYLESLGIEGLYCSPIFLSGSSSGYDVLDPNLLNPNLGVLEDWELLCNTLKEKGMKLVLDIVPNHMSIKSSQNQWWYDVLKNGKDSPYAHYFDINWEKNKIILPILEASYGYLLENGQIQLSYDGDFWIVYRDYKLPLALPSSLFLLKEGVEIAQLLKTYNESSKALHELLEMQYYRLAYWKVAGQEINYRRFFDINDLIAIHIENEKVLNDHHKWIFEILSSKKAQGVRVDHPDGLYDPTEYFRRLKKAGPSFIIIEKVLDMNESLPEEWCVDGTVGYDFLNILNGLFVQNKNEERMKAIYESFINESIDFKTLLYERKKSFVHLNLSSEIRFLGKLLNDFSEKNIYTRDFTRVELTLAIKEIIASFPVYRTYIRKGQPLSKRDSKYILAAIEMARNKTPEIDVSLYEWIKDLFIQDQEREKPDVLDFILRFQQITAPVMAKALEDSVYYIYNTLLSLNEVGGNPQKFGVSKAEFYEFNREQLKKWPLSFLVTSTHDTKRSHDSRMRLNVLSEIPDEWQKIGEHWKQCNQSFKEDNYPEPNTEYFIYQQLLGIWPREKEKEFFERFWSCILKAIREAGIYTSWRSPNENYEKACRNFVAAILDEKSTFFSSFLSFWKKIDLLGAQNSISSFILMIGSCGIVDIYQGTEMLTYLAQDPDNRRLVDFKKEGGLKQSLISIGLKFRKAHKQLFIDGEFIPLKIQGEYGEHCIAFMRQFKEETAIFIAERYFCDLPKNWGGTFIELPREMILEDIFTNNTFSKQNIPLEKVFLSYPVAILTVGKKE